MEDSNKKEELPKKKLLLIFFVILLLSFSSYWNLKNWRKSLKEIKLPTFEMPKFEPLPKQEGTKEFVSTDGKLKIKYPADWMEMDAQVFKNYSQKEIEGEILFLAQKLSFEKAAYSFLIVQKLGLEENQGVEAIIEMMKKDTESREGKMEILKLEVENKEANFEAKYTAQTGPSQYSKEKIILNEGKVYLIACLTLEENWPDFQKEAEEIINSATFLD